MTEQHESFPFEQRLGKQFHGFCDLTELITLRILEIEQKLVLFEEKKALKENHYETEINQILNDATKKASNLKSLLKDESKKRLEKKDFSQNLDNNILGNLSPLDLEDFHSLNNKSDQELQPDLSLSIEINEKDFAGEDDFLETEYIDDPQMPIE